MINDSGSHVGPRSFGAVVASVVVCAVSFVACAHVLEARYVKYFQTTEVSESPTAVLNISGSLMSSSETIDSVATVVEGDTLVVVVSVHVVRAGESSSLSKDIEIPPFINTVVFGAERRVIWRREGGTVP